MRVASVCDLRNTQAGWGWCMGALWPKTTAGPTLWPAPCDRGLVMGMGRTGREPTFRISERETASEADLPPAGLPLALLRLLLCLLLLCHGGLLKVVHGCTFRSEETTSEL